jgi:hypothetical protein
VDAIDAGRALPLLCLEEELLDSTNAVLLELERACIRPPHSPQLAVLLLQ